MYVCMHQSHVALQFSKATMGYFIRRERKSIYYRYSGESNKSTYEISCIVASVRYAFVVLSAILIEFEFITTSFK